MVDFEKCYFGPAGLDLGLFLSNYLFYYAAHPNPAARRSLSGGASAVLEAYRSAFVVQAMGARREQHQDELDLEALLDEVGLVISLAHSLISSYCGCVDFA